MARGRKQDSFSGKPGRGFKKMMDDSVDSIQECFEPVAASSARLLILGSFPGQLSLQKTQYYGHPRNCFWIIMAGILGFDPAITYPERIEKLVENHIALWDVMRSCRRDGSLDTAIETDSIVVNDFGSLFRRCARLDTICFNGSRAQKEFMKHVLPLMRTASLDCELFRLPSTSPALASLSLEQKLAAWMRIKDRLHRTSRPLSQK
jgi:hypoxanthine-DNA glycosylase